MFNLQPGDKVVLTGEPNRIYTIVDIDINMYSSSMYKVEYEITPTSKVTMWVWEDRIESIHDLSRREEPVTGCECGVAAAYKKPHAWMHSVWCRVYRKGEHE